MQNICIITPYGLFNYGNRLQNYALTFVLSELGFNCFTLNYRNMSGAKAMLKELAKPLIWNRFNSSIRAVRYRSFRQFDARIEKQSVSSRNRLQTIGKEVDLICIGSDQIWNPNHLADSDYQFATFAPKEKRIAYAPSFGIDELPAACLKTYRAGIESIRALSVREKAGARIIKELTGREATVVLDPTLLLDKAQWNEVATDRMVPDNDYVFSYFLGKNAEKERSLVEEFCQYNGMRNVEVMNLSRPEYYSAGPQDFIALIRNASLVCTNSFHAAVFSMIYKRPLNIFEREDDGEASMNSRIVSFVEQFELWNCLLSIDEKPHIVQVSSERSKKILARARTESMDYLRKALEVC